MFNDFVFSRWSRSKINGYIDTDRELMIIDFFQESNIQFREKFVKNLIPMKSFETKYRSKNETLHDLLTCVIFA